MKPRQGNENTCEHGDHEAPNGQRFCSKACEWCEHESESNEGCDGICYSLTSTQRDLLEQYQGNQVYPRGLGQHRSAEALIRKGLIKDRSHYCATWVLTDEGQRLARLLRVNPAAGERA